MTDAEQVMFNLPPGVSLTINGVTATAQGILDLDEIGGSIPLALAYLYRALESDNMQSETIGKYSYTKFAMRGSEYWELRASIANINANAPNVIVRPSSVGCWPWGGGYIP